MDDTFAAQYKNPLWQKKRLEAMDDAGFECQNCGSQEKQLHVHHRRYVKGRKVWEYDNTELDVLCDACHEKTHKNKEQLHKLLAEWPDTESIIALVSGFIDANYEGADAPEDTEHRHPLYLAAFVAEKLYHTDDKFILAIDKNIRSAYWHWHAEIREKNNGSEGAENNGKN